MARWRLPPRFASLPPRDAHRLQEALAGRIREEPLRVPLSLIAGVDAAYDERGGVTYSAAALWEVERGEIVEVSTSTLGAAGPYRPGLLAWRELPALLAALGGLARGPHLVLVDGHGRAHPRRCGLACLVGLALDRPTAGCAKSVLVGGLRGLDEGRGSTTPLLDRGEIVGAAVRTRTGVRPVYVSVGHRVTLAAAVAAVLDVSRFRVPEPLRAAHTAVTRLRGPLR